MVTALTLLPVKSAGWLGFSIMGRLQPESVE
jgi:hypothetical protein